MVESQLMTGEVLSPAVLEAMMAIPRENFVPEKYKAVAYVDEDIEIARGRFLLEPLIFGRLIGLAEIEPSDRVLVVGAATGYSAAVLSHLAAKVVGVEEQADLTDKAHQAIRKLGISNAEIVVGMLGLGCGPSSPYDVIFIDGAVQVIPSAITDQLAEGGRLVTVENKMLKPGSRAGLGKALLIKKKSGKLFSRKEFDANASLLPGFEQKPQFTF